MSPALPFLHTTDPERWTSWCRELGLDSPYYRPEYARLWAEEESAECLVIRYNGSTGAVLYPVLKVDLAILPGGEGYVDLRTPYDFGGPLAVAADSERLLQEFEVAFPGFARELNVVTEFARLHPFRGRNLTSSEFHADQYVIDLELGYEAIRGAYHATFSRNVRKASASRIDVVIEASPPGERIEAFVSLYRDTMNRLGAGREYMFSDSTIKRLLALPEMSLATASRDGVPVSVALVLRDGDDLFYYLQASDLMSRPLCPTNLLLDVIVREGVESGRRRLHLGGGSEGLRKFKSQLATSTVPFSVLRRVHLPQAYRMICDQVADSKDSPVFPAYRPEQFRESGGGA